jgi:hypothetical protein
MRRAKLPKKIVLYNRKMAMSQEPFLIVDSQKLLAVQL